MNIQNFHKNYVFQQSVLQRFEIFPFTSVSLYLLQTEENLSRENISIWIRRSLPVENQRFATKMNLINKTVWVKVKIQPKLLKEKLITSKLEQEHRVARCSY